MSSIMRRGALIALVGSFSACSSQPATPPAARAPETTLSVPASSVDTNARPATDATAAEKPAGKIPSGYRRVTRGGKEYFCRSETTVGTKLPETLCFTRDQLKEIAERTDSVMDAVGRGCVGNRCGGT
jgi:hypothetical protein